MPLVVCRVVELVDVNGVRSGRPPRLPARTQIAPWRKRVEQDSYDGEAWQALIAELAALPSSPELLLERRALYDEFLTHFPTAVSSHPG